MEAPLHKVCGTRHWSNQPCPAMREPKTAASVGRKGHDRPKGTDEISGAEPGSRSKPRITAELRASDTDAAGSEPAARGPGAVNGATTKRGRPASIKDMRAYKAQKQREYRARNKGEKP